MKELNFGGSLPPRGHLSLRHRRDLGDLAVRKAPPLWHLRNWLQYRLRELPGNVAMDFAGHIRGVILLRTNLHGVKYSKPLDLAPWQELKLQQLLRENFPLVKIPALFGGVATDYGLLSTRIVTTAGVGFIVDAWQNLVELENMKFHAFGTGATAAVVGDTALQTELTTQYNPDNTRPTGSLAESAANVFRTVATFSPDTGGTIAVTEWGLLTQAATGGGTLMDRIVFAAVNLVAGSDSLQTTFDATFAAGG